MQSKPYLFMILPILLMAACQSSGQTAGQQQSPGEWITLFDGESLEQWRGYNREDLPEAWSIEGDELVFTPGTGDGGISSPGRSLVILSSRLNITSVRGVTAASFTMSWSRIRRSTGPVRSSRLLMMRPRPAVTSKISLPLSTI